MRRVILAFLLLFAVSAVAIADDAAYSDSEKVAFAFAKLGHFKLDYAAMVKATPAYDKATPVDKVELMRAEIPRLETGFDAYDPQQDLIHVMADARIERTANQPLKLVFPDRVVSFPFTVGDFSVDIIPVGLQASMPLTLSATDDAAFRQAMGGGRTMPVVLEMRLQPVRVDANHPRTEQGQPVWPMAATIQQIALWDQSRQHMLWSYDTPGFQSADTRRLNDLYIK